MWEKICRTSSRVPTNSSAESGVGYIYDPFVAAGEAVAFVGGRIAVNAPLYWMSGALDYNGMVKTVFGELFMNLIIISKTMEWRELLQTK